MNTFMDNSVKFLYHTTSFNSLIYFLSSLTFIHEMNDCFDDRTAFTYLGGGQMTSMSAEYSKLLENRRHNLEQERIAAQEAAATVQNAQTRIAELEETRRHQRASEQINIYSADKAAQGRVDAATISADASKFATKMNAISAKLKIASDQQIAALNNETKKDIATADRNLNSWIASENQRLTKIRDEQTRRAKQSELQLQARRIANEYEIAYDQMAIEKAKIGASTLNSLLGLIGNVSKAFLPGDAKGVASSGIPGQNVSKGEIAEQQRLDSYNRAPKGDNSLPSYGTPSGSEQYARP